MHFLHQVLDCDRGGTLSFMEMAEGLRKMPYSPPIALTFDDFNHMYPRALGLHCRTRIVFSFKILDKTQLFMFACKCSITEAAAAAAK